MEPIPASLLVLLWSALCAVQDARQGRISLWLLYSAIAVAGLHLFLFGHSLLGGSVADVAVAVLLALVLTLPGYVRRQFGGGDVKILLALALAGTTLFTLLVFAVSAVTLALWAAARPRLWPRLPGPVQERLAALGPDRSKLAYAPFLLLAVITALPFTRLPLLAFA